LQISATSKSMFFYIFNHIVSEQHIWTTQDYLRIMVTFLTLSFRSSS